MKIFNIILNLTQPMTVVVFIVSGLCCLKLGKLHQGWINLFISATNWMIFYGGKFLK